MHRLLRHIIWMPQSINIQQYRHSNLTGLSERLDVNGYFNQPPNLPIQKLRRTNCYLIGIFLPTASYYFATSSRYEKLIGFKIGRSSTFFITKQFQSFTIPAAWPIYAYTLDMASKIRLIAKCGILGMWRPVLTYGLLTITITGLTLFNLMT